jgi:hypothetical protein
MPWARSLLVVAAIVTACNAPPEGGSVGIVPELPSTLDDLVAEITADAVDPNGDTVRYAFAWSVDGELQADLTGDTVPAARTARDQVWTVEITPSDDKTEGEPASAEVRILNTPPTATVSISPDEPRSDEDLVASSTFDDVDGDTVTVSYSWTVGGADAGIDSATVPADRTAKGDRWEVTATPSDGTEVGTAATAFVDVANLAPIVESVRIEPASAFEDTVLTAVHVATDADGDPLTPTVTWLVNGADVEVPGTTLTGSHFDKGDSVVVGISVNDGFVSSVRVTSDPIVIQNSVPAVERAIIDPTDLAEDTVASCRGTGWTDADGDAAAYDVLWEVGGIIVGTGATLDGADFDKGESVVCELTPNDGEDTGTPVRSDPITVGNTPPSLAGVSLSPSSPTTSDDVVATPGPTTDLDGDSVTVEYSWSVDGVTVATGATLSASMHAKGQAVQVTATPTDGEDSGAPRTASVTVINSAPVLTSVSLSPSVVRTADDTTVSWAGSDPDDDKLTATVTWKVDGASVGTGTTLSASEYIKGQKIEASVVLSDGALTSKAMTASTTVQNTAPGAPTVGIGPTGADTEDDLLCSIAKDAPDDDGDSLGYTLTWTVDGKSFTGATTTTLAGDTVPDTNTTRGQVWECTALPTDGTDTGTAASASLTIANSLPTLASASISPTSPLTADALTASPGTASDPDGDKVTFTYAWTIGGTTVGTAATLPATAHKKGDTVAVAVRPNDGIGTGTAVGASVKIGNTRPKIDSAVLSPTTVYETSTLSVSFSASDADSDSLSPVYTWSVNGVKVSSASTLDGSSFKKGDVIDLAFQVDDGTDLSTVSAFTRSVANSVPTTPVVELGAAPIVGTDLDCKITKVSTDADGDKITYTYVWDSAGKTVRTVSGTSATSDTLAGRFLVANEKVTCSVTANDGTANSGTASDSDTARGPTVSGFSGEYGPVFTGWTQCEGYLDTTKASEIPAAWGDDCTDKGTSSMKLVCGTSAKSYRYIDVARNVFRDSLTTSPTTGLISNFYDQSGTAYKINDIIYTTKLNPHDGSSWWNGPDGCGESNLNLTVNNICTYEASNCFGQGITGDRYLYVYVK